MPGSITFRPIEAKLTHNTEFLGKMSPYCAFHVGNEVFKGQICKKGGKQPQWNDAVTVPVGNQSQVVVELMDKDKFNRDDNIGTCQVSLNDLQRSGESAKWYPLTYKNKPAGEILMEASFSGDMGYGQSGFTQGERLRESFTSDAMTQRSSVTDRHLFTEQSQVVEPRTFTKEVDVVETRAHVENIEILEPQRVLREVQYTQAVPVTKQIEVNEPRVVMKEVEVIEPRLVTKTIQVIENVPVMKQVEVIESVSRMQQVQTFEPQTFTKQVEVTDYVPVQKQVTITEPFHMKKTVEFVEPVITTKTITRELAEPVIIDEKITTTVGPASLTRESGIYGNQFQKLGISEEERMYRFGEWKKLRGQGYNDQKLESHFSTLGWGPVTHYRFHELGDSQYGSQSGSNFGNQLGWNEQDRLSRFGEWRRLRGQGYNDQQLDSHFTTQGWGPTSNYRFHELGESQYGNQSGSNLGNQPGWNEQERLSRFGEWGRLRGQGYNDQQLDSHFTTQGWGPVSNYKFHELGGSQYGSQSSSYLGNQNSFNEQDRLSRFGEWEKLRGQGYNDQQLDSHFTSQGWGPTSNYRFHELSSKSGLSHGSKHRSGFFGHRF